MDTAMYTSLSGNHAGADKASFKAAKTVPPYKLAHDRDNDMSDDEMFSTSSHDTKDKQIRLQCSATKCQDCSAFNQTEDNQSMDFSSLSNMSNQQQKYLHERYGHTLALNH
mmetsp:Transcript_30414/g.35420  ORF Transcript_30414/g.35420 Transcript_30414/m.35420 type:complete len:111 (+) Transcript_30414:772-1104(+)